MGLINFKDIDFNKSIDKELKIFEFNGSEIGVVPYLPIDDKYDFVMITLQKSLEKGIYNYVKLDMYFDLHLVYMYTNIVIEDENRKNEDVLFDILTKSGFIKKLKENISQTELDLLKGYIQETEKNIMKYRNTFGSIVSAFVEQLPEKMEKAKEIIENFDTEKIKNLVEMTGLLDKVMPEEN